MSELGCRLDTYLVQKGYVSGRQKAKELLAAGYVKVNGTVVTKSSRQVSVTDVITCDAPPARYVGRGGLKLEKAITDVELQLVGLTAMDVGASTGGFTDCLLQHGAKHVYAVDVGHDQLHPSLRADARVTVLEGTDVRSPALAAAVPAGSVPFCTVDVSFVSLAHILPALMPYLTDDAHLVCLIKPQFEAGRSGVGKRGVVRDKRVHIRVLDTMLSLFSQQGCGVMLLTYSPITGGEGNIEYIAVLQRGGEMSGNAPNTPAIVEAAFAALHGKERILCE
ncbi:MAG: TlyA family RNA methyltransferase [Clostridia bacterium]|nr:TlyA family RNA methyltransferase [Clostridia bacterium]